MSQRKSVIYPQAIWKVKAIDYEKKYSEFDLYDIMNAQLLFTVFLINSISLSGKADAFCGKLVRFMI